MIKRREFFPLATTAVAATAVAGTSSLAQAATAACATKATTADVPVDPVNQTPAQLAKHSIRLPKLDQQSTQDFFSSLRMWMRNASPDLGTQVEALAAARGLNPADMPMDAAWQLAMTHPTFAARARINTSSQQLMWRGIADVYHKDADAYYAALAATDRSGPGSLELNPGMALPEYTRYEIHIQPGGYVGDEFAGAISLHGFKHFDRQFSFNDHQEHHLAMAREMPLPCDGQVRRVLDLGCGWGGLATALKERFPEADVWGIDVGGPMVRWAHHRAVKMNLAVNFAQRLGEDSKFEAGSFDIVGSYIMFHEVSAEAAQRIVAETYRILRPGGLFRVIDFVTRGNPEYREPKTVMAKAGQWADHRYNMERWAPEYRGSDFPAVLRSAGFQVSIDPKRPGAFQEVTATKPA
ncbi:MAG: class I SAM-dependent methyltransferase [Steroidobacteraceae bacterium]